MAKLTPKQAKFVSEYLIDLNATKAAERSGYSKKTAAEQASRLLANVKIADALADKQSKRFAKREITADRILDELAKMAFLDVRTLFTPDGKLIPIAELSDDAAASVAGIEVTSGALTKIKIADKYRGLELLGKHLRLFVDRVENSVDDGQMDQLMAAIARS